MDNFTEPKKYLRVHHGEPCTITNVAKKEWKGKESIVVTFASLNDGSLIDLKLKLPMNEFDKKKSMTLMALGGVAKMTDLVGKEMSVTVQRRDWEGKPLFNPNGFAPIGYTTGDEPEGRSDDQDDISF